MSQNKSSAVMNQRAAAPDGLDDFPTPPWVTRALIDVVFRKLGLYVGGNSLRGARVWEPAAGRGLMSETLREYECDVFTSDVHRYEDAPRAIDRCGSFVGEGPDVLKPPNFRHSSRGAGIDFVITNPPFRLALEFALRALREADVVALLCRSNWAETEERYVGLFSKHPPLAIAQFAERAAILDGGGYLVDDGNGGKVRKLAERGGYQPAASTATAYSWFVWMNGASTETRFIFIPPGQKKRLSKPSDIERFAMIKGDTML